MNLSMSYSYTVPTSPKSPKSGLGPYASMGLEEAGTHDPLVARVVDLVTSHQECVGDWAYLSAEDFRAYTRRRNYDILRVLCDVRVLERETRRSKKGYTYHMYRLGTGLGQATGWSYEGIVQVVAQREAEQREQVERAYQTEQAKLNAKRQSQRDAKVWLESHCDKPHALAQRYPALRSGMTKTDLVASIGKDFGLEQREAHVLHDLIHKRLSQHPAVSRSRAGGNKPYVYRIDMEVTE